MVGMKAAKNIIAINKDQEAPIFRHRRTSVSSVTSPR